MPILAGILQGPRWGSDYEGVRVMAEVGLKGILEQRIRVTHRIIKALGHLSREHAMAVVCCNMSIAKLEEIADFQEGE